MVVNGKIVERKIKFVNEAPVHQRSGFHEALLSCIIKKLLVVTKRRPVF